MDGCEAWVRFLLLAVAPAGKLILSFFIIEFIYQTIKFLNRRHD
jgi:hypothetical protein